jgi:hypothetical protein
MRRRDFIGLIGAAALIFPRTGYRARLHIGQDFGARQSVPALARGSEDLGHRHVATIRCAVPSVATEVERTHRERRTKQALDPTGS